MTPHEEAEIDRWLKLPETKMLLRQILTTAQEKAKQQQAQTISAHQ